MKLYFVLTGVYAPPMRATHTIESIFGTRSRTRVLGVLHGVTVPLNPAQVARQAGLSQPAAATALKELEQLGLVRASRVGWARVFWLMRDNVYVEQVVEPAFEAYDAMGDLLEDELRVLFGDLCVSIVVFGSYARDEQTSDSDVDVVLVASDAGSRLKVEQAVVNEAGRFQSRWGASLSALVYDLATASALPATSPALFAEIDRDGIVVSGLEPYEWETHAGT